MNDQPITSIEIKLTALYEQGPSEDFVRELGKTLQDHPAVKTSTWRGWMGGLPRSPRLRLAWSAAALLVLAVTLMAFTPQGHALAQNILHFFLTTQSTSYPLDPTQKAYMQGSAYPSPVPTLIPPLETLDDTVYSAPSPYLITLKKAENTLGFIPKILSFAESPADFMIQDVSLNEADGALLIVYNDHLGITIFLDQGIGEFPAPQPPWDLVLADSIENVAVNGNPGEYVEGAFGVAVNDGVYSNEATWDTTATDIARMRWMEGTRWFSITRVNNPGNSFSFTRDDLIAVAEKMVPFGVDRSSPIEIQSILDQPDFGPLLPRKLPTGFVFRYGQYDQASHNLLLVYSSGADLLAIVESKPSTNGDSSIVYNEFSFNGPELCQKLYWTRAGKDLQLYYFQSVPSSSTGIRLQKDDLISIADSIK